MPEVTPNTSSPIGSSTNISEKPKRNWKKILLLLFIALFIFGLVGVGLYLLIPRLTEEPSATPQKQASPSAQKQPAGKKGVLYIKANGEVSKPLHVSLGNLVIHNLSDSKETSLTSDGKVGKFNVSPDKEKILFVRYLDKQHSVWVFDLKNKQEEKLGEISEVVSEKEYATIDDLLWRADSKAAAYLALNRPTDDDPRAIKKSTLYVINLDKKDGRTIDLPLGFGIPGFLGWGGDKIFYANSTDDGGLQELTSVNLVDKSTTDESILINKENMFGLPSVYGSPDSRKFYISASDIKVVEIPSKKEEVISSNPSDLLGFGWGSDGDTVVLLSKKGDKLKITLRQLDEDKMKFALFPFSEEQPYLQIVGAFSDNDNLVGCTSGEAGYSYWLINLAEASKKKILSSSEFKHLAPIENY